MGVWEKRFRKASDRLKILTLSNLPPTTPDQRETVGWARAWAFQCQGAAELCEILGR